MNTQQYKKSNNVAQNDKRYNATLRRRNYEEKKLDLHENHLFKMNREKKEDENGDFKSNIDPKHPLN